jgi:hypothetical protein
MQDSYQGHAEAAARREWIRPTVQRMSAGSAEDGAKPDSTDSGQKPS